PERAPVDDLAFRDPERRSRPLIIAGNDDTELERTQSQHAVDLRGDVLQRLDAVPEARRVLEAQLAGEPLQLRTQLRQRVLDRLPLHALQGARRELGAAAALDRPELRRLRRANDAVTTAPEVDVAVRSRRASVRRRPELADQTQLLERG